jgi:L-asparaginase II
VRIGTVRSGVVEAYHEVTVVAVDAAGRVLESDGPNGDRVFFLRSAAKPFQAAIAQRWGAGLGPEQTAVACGSHGAQPVHITYVRAMLSEVGLGEDSLLCPAVRPMSIGADRRLAGSGESAGRRIYNNCSGKHAAMLRACVARGWPLDYTDPSHPLQVETIGYVSRVTDGRGEPVGVDGCGVPTIRASTFGLARAYARLAVDPELADVADAMNRFASLTADGDRGEARLARWAGGAAKGGAMGCLGFAHPTGVGIAAKSWGGRIEPAVVAVIAVLRRLGLLSEHPGEALAEVGEPPVLGGGKPVGRLEILEGSG